MAARFVEMALRGVDVDVREQRDDCDGRVAGCGLERRLDVDVGRAGREGDGAGGGGAARVRRRAGGRGGGVCLLFVATTFTIRFPYVRPRRTIEIVESMLRTSFC